jgi:hypothetical protein
VVAGIRYMKPEQAAAAGASQAQALGAKPPACNHVAPFLPFSLCVSPSGHTLYDLPVPGTSPMSVVWHTAC